MPARPGTLQASTYVALVAYLAVSALGCGEGSGGTAPKVSPLLVGSTETPPPPPPPVPAVAQSSARATAEPTEAPAPAEPTSAASAAPAGDQLALGKQVFENQKCDKCHRMEAGSEGPGPGFGGPPPGGFGGSKGGPGGRGPGGPSLAHVGSKPDRTAQWLADHIRDPKSHNPRSRMPSFGPDKISDPDLAALGEYLASLK